MASNLTSSVTFFLRKTHFNTQDQRVLDGGENGERKKHDPNSPVSQTVSNVGCCITFSCCSFDRQLTNQLIKN